MAKENPKNVARKVSESIRKGKLVNLGKIIKKSGYSEATSKSPTVVTNTKAYQEEIKPIVRQMERERQRIMTEMENKDLTKVQYEGLGRVFDAMTKNIQLLSGGVTERSKISIEISKEIADKNNVS